MPGIKISSLPISPLAPADIMPAARGGATVGIEGREFLDRFANLGTRIDNLSANSIFVNNSPTINLTFNSFTRRLSADFAATLDLRSREVFLPLKIEMSPGMICPFAGTAAPEGWLICDGSVGLPNGFGVFQGKAADFSRLFAVLGTTYGATPGTLPDLRGYFVRGFGQAGLIGANGADGTISGNFGQRQADAFQGHKHGLYDPQHAHGITDPQHAHGITDPQHAHEITDPGHTHPVKVELIGDLVQQWPEETDPGNDNGDQEKEGGGGVKVTIESATTGITVNVASTGITVNANSTGITVNNGLTNVKVLSATGDTATPGSGDTNGPGGATPRVADETRPKNVALLYCIKY